MDKANSASPPRKPRRIVRKIVVAVVLLVVALLLFVQFGLGFAVRNGAKAAGPAVIGTPITIGSTHFRPFTGVMKMGDLVVGAPEGFKANVFELNGLSVVFDPQSLLSDTIVIKEVTISDPIVSYELSGLNHNIGAILKKLESAEKSERKEKEKTGERPGRKVVVEHFVFSGAKIRIASTALGGKGAVVPMPSIELHDIGKKSGGATTLEVLSDVLGSIGKGVLGAVKDAAFSVGGAAVDAVGAVGGAALEAVDEAGKAAVRTVGAAGGAAVDAAGAAGGAAIDAASAVGGAAVDAVGAVGGAAVGGVKAVGSAIGGIFGGGSKTNAPAKDPAPGTKETDETSSETPGKPKSGGVKGMGEAVVDSVTDVGGAAIRTVGAVGGATLDAASAVGGAAVGGAKAVGGAAVGGAKAVGGAAVGGAKAVGGAAADGAKALGGAIGGIFGGSDKADTNRNDAAKSE
ncbi:MAG: hypothetical protein ACOX9C_03090 [Kiritimatiellia bacterium]|jgi:hypothetical protein